MTSSQLYESLTEEERDPSNHTLIDPSEYRVHWHPNIEGFETIDDDNLKCNGTKYFELCYGEKV